MNHTFRKKWNARLGAFVAVSEITCTAGTGRCAGTLVATLALSLGAAAHAQLAPGALPTGGQISVGEVRIATQDRVMTVTQSSPRAAINWQGFSIGQDASVRFNQPDASSMTLNRVVGNERSVIAGTLNANGQVFLLNPNGVYFGAGSRVDVGALVASTRGLSDTDFVAGRITLTGSGAGAVDNRGHITAADGGYVALIGRSVRNDGVVSARLGTVAAAAGDRVSLNFNGNSLVGVSVERGTLEALVANGGAIRADGGQILLSARAAEGLVDAVVNNTGELRARTIEQRGGRIVLQADMTHGQAQVGGTLDASAPAGGDGGFIETSGARVNVDPGTRVTTLATAGQTGQWLLDPTDFSIDAGSGAQTSSSIGASTLATSLASTHVSLATAGAGSGAGDIRVQSPVTWNAPTRLTLSAHGDIVIGADITAQHSNGQLQLEVGQAALAAGNPSSFRLTNGARINLQAGDNFFTRQGSDGTLEVWRVITQLGSAGSTTGTDLQGIAGQLAGRYVLGADIDASGTVAWNGGAGFEPLGAYSNGSTFTGRFDGLGHSITGLTINRADQDHVGLFGFGEGAAIGRVRLIDVAIVGKDAVGALVGGGNNGLVIIGAQVSGAVSGGEKVGGVLGAAVGRVSASSSSAAVSGRDYTGGLVGLLESSDAFPGSGGIDASTASGAVGGAWSVGGLVGRATTVRSSSASGTVNASGHNVGGLAGGANEVVDSWATGAVTAAGNAVGGLVGAADTISGSWASGHVSGVDHVGGLAGFVNFSVTGVTGVVTARGNVSGGWAVGGLVGQAATVRNASASGTVNATGDRAGGLAGVITDEVAASSASGAVTSTGSVVGGLVGEAKTITDSMASGDVSGAWSVGGLVGQATTVRSSSASGKVSASGSNVGGLAGAATEITDSWATGVVSASGDAVGGLVGSAGTITGSWASGDVTGTNQVGGLAGLVNVSVTGVTGVVTARGHVSGGWAVGGLVGQAATVRTASASGTVNASGNNVGGLAGVVTLVADSTASGGVTSSGDAAGGLAGSAGTITGSSAIGDVSGAYAVGGLAGYVTQLVTGSTASGAVRGGHYAGGLVGHLLGDVRSSSASGHVTATGSLVGGLVGWGNKVSDSSASGNVEGGGYVGGLAGQVGDSLTRGQATGNVVATGSTAGGLVGAATQVVDSTATGTVTAVGSVVGGLAGWASTVSGSRASGAVSGDGYVGGLVGQSVSSVTTSSASGHVTGTAPHVGGLVGHGDGSVSESSATGAVSGRSQVGGLVGAINGTVSNAWASGTVTATGPVVGGLVGEAWSVTGSHASGSVSGTANVGGLVGVVSVEVRDSWSSGAVSGSRMVGGLVGTSGESTTLVNSHYNLDAVRIMIDGVDQSAQVTRGGLYGAQHAAWVAAGRTALNPANYYSADADGRWQLGSVADLKNLLAFAYDPTHAFRLTRDIDVSSAPGWHLPVFAGSLDGAYKMIHGLQTLQGWNSRLGLIGTLTGSVRRLGVTGTVQGFELSGGLAGVVWGSVDESYAAVDVSGQFYLGGLTGTVHATGSVTNSYADGTVRGLPGVVQSAVIGSLAGSNFGLIERSYGAATVTCAGDCFAAGGLVGLYDLPTTRSFSILSRAGSNPFGQMVVETALEDASARQAATWAAAGWSIGSASGSGTIWRIYEGQTFPLLRGFLTPVTVSGTAVKRQDGDLTMSAPTLSYDANVDAARLLGTPTGTTVSSAIGVQAMSLSGLYSDQQGYDVAYGASQGVIVPPLIEGLAESVAAGLRDAPGPSGRSSPTLPRHSAVLLAEVPAAMAEAFPSASNLILVGTPLRGEPARAVGWGMATRLAGQGDGVRIPVVRDLPLNLVGGGLHLPPQVEQVLFVVAD